MQGRSARERSTEEAREVEGAQERTELPANALEGLAKLEIVRKEEKVTDGPRRHSPDGSKLKRKLELDRKKGVPSLPSPILPWSRGLQMAVRAGTSTGTPSVGIVNGIALTTSSYHIISLCRSISEALGRVFLKPRQGLVHHLHQKGLGT